jgi:hypothetical protein
MKLYTALTAVAVFVLISTAAFAGGKTSFGIGGAVYIGGNTGNWSTAGAAASGQADVNTGTTTNYSSGNAQTAKSGYGATVPGAAAYADATNNISTTGTGEVQSSTSVGVASGTGPGIGGGLIVGGAANSVQH